MPNQNLNELIEKYKLTKEEHNNVLESLKKELFMDKVAQENPCIIFVIGQPGCGKTTFIKSVDFSNCIIINSDYYRSFSKYSKEILDKYPTDYANLTNFDAHLWGDELLSYALENGYSVLREKSPIDYSLLDFYKTIPHNYNVIINVVIAGNLTSSLATRERYEKEVIQCNNAKLSSIEAHNKCYSLLPDFISRCLFLGVKVNYIISVDNQFKTIPVKDDYLHLLQKFRNESNEKTCLNYEARMDNIKKSMINRKASQKQFIELEKIESIYSKVNML